MYPSSEGSSLNHEKGYCGDGIKQVSKLDEVMLWPQLQGIFTAGKTFHPQAFYVTVQDIHEQYCIPTAEPPPITSIEAVVFAKLLASCIHIFSNSTLTLRLFADYELDPMMPAGYLFQPKDGSSGKWLHLAYLQGSANLAT